MVSADIPDSGSLSVLLRSGRLLATTEAITHRLLIMAPDIMAATATKVMGPESGFQAIGNEGGDLTAGKGSGFQATGDIEPWLGSGQSNELNGQGCCRVL